MVDKKTIKIQLVDMGKEIDPENTWIISVLRKYYNVEISDQPDFLFYSCFGMQHLKFNNCVKIFLTGENVLPDFNQCDYGQGFDCIDFGNRYFRKYYYMPNREICNRSKVTTDMLNRKFCNFIYSNENNGPGAVLRQEFCKKLMDYKHVDCPGRVLNNMSDAQLSSRNSDNYADSKAKFLKGYKFTIAFENSASPGYTTEKLFQPIASFSVPIYWGNPDVVRDFNPEAFINCNEYGNDWDAVVARVRELDTDPEKYMAMLRACPVQPTFDFSNGDNFEKWIVSIIERGNKPFMSDPLNFSDVKRLEHINKKYEKVLQECNLLYQLRKFIYSRKETKHYIRLYICGMRILKLRKSSEL